MDIEKDIKTIVGYFIWASIRAENRSQQARSRLHTAKVQIQNAEASLDESDAFISSTVVLAQILSGEVPSEERMANAEENLSHPSFEALRKACDAAASLGSDLTAMAADLASPELLTLVAQAARERSEKDET